MLVTLATAVHRRQRRLVHRAHDPAVAADLGACSIVLPAAVPDFIVGYAWHSIAPSLTGLKGAAIVMSLALYPLVYLPVAAALRRVDPALEETARSLGCGPWTTFRRVTLPQIRPALLGGCLVVMLALLAEFGAFEILNFQTFTTEVFTEFRVDQSAAAALALVLVALGIVVLSGEGFVAGRGRVSRSGSGSRPSRGTAPARQVADPDHCSGFTALVGLSLGVPIGTLVYWLAVKPALDAARGSDAAFRHVRDREVRGCRGRRWPPSPRFRSDCCPTCAAAGR